MIVNGLCLAVDVVVIVLMDTDVITEAQDVLNVDIQEKEKVTIQLPHLCLMAVLLRSPRNSR